MNFAQVQPSDVTAVGVALKFAQALINVRLRQAANLFIYRDPLAGGIDRSRLLLRCLPLFPTVLSSLLF